MLSHRERSRLAALLDQRDEASQALYDFLKDPASGLDASSPFWELDGELRARSTAVEAYLVELRAKRGRSVTVL